FGGIVGLNRPIDEQTARAIVSTFIEVVIAPGLEPGAAAILWSKANMRVLTADFGAMRGAAHARELRSILGAVLLQARDEVVEGRHPWPTPDLRVVTKRQPTADEWEALRFAWRVMAHVKSNTIIFTDRHQTKAIGAGQMSR